jgi:DNA-binding CsgD family transcriptional regulator
MAEQARKGCAEATGRAAAIDCNRPTKAAPLAVGGMFPSAERVQLAALWDDLVAGTAKIQGFSHSPQTWTLHVTRSPRAAGQPPTAIRTRDAEILEHALLCGVRKHVASEVGLSCSSIAVILQSCIEFMGLHCLPSRIPGLLVAAAHARHAYPELVGGGVSRAVEQTITVPRPDVALAAWLAPAEHAVIALLIEGRCYAEIAKIRETSVRTVANQVASGFRRIGVSGRAELLCVLARWGMREPELPPRRPPSIVPGQPRRRAAREARLSGVSASHVQSHSPALAT